jgi:hypothetical protein
MRCADVTADITYRIGGAHGLWAFARDGMQPLAASDPGELLFLFDRDLSTQLQRRRPELLFIHAAVLEVTGLGILLVAPSGGGKSTLAWALVHHGFHYLSDELSPVDVTTLTVHPYPRALLLKHPTPPPYELPSRTIHSSRGFHVVSPPLSGHSGPSGISAIFFLCRHRGVSAPVVRQITTAQASARLYCNTLNALAHPGEGLDGTIQIASTTTCFELVLQDLSATCALLKATVQRLVSVRPRPRPPARRRRGPAAVIPSPAAPAVRP